MNRRNTFTLIEILMVVAIIAILSGLTIGGVKFAFDSSEKAAIRSRMKTMEMALEEYRRDWGYYPIYINSQPASGGGELVFNNFVSPAPASKRYLEDSTDPYRQTQKGVPMHYRYPGTNNTEKYDLWAPGLDEIINNDDDITNWDQN